MAEPRVERERPASWGRAQRLALGGLRVALLLAAVLGAALGHSGYKAKGLLEADTAGIGGVNGLAIYARPLTVYRGQRLVVDDFVARARAAGHDVEVTSLPGRVRLQVRARGDELAGCTLTLREVARGRGRVEEIRRRGTAGLRVELQPEPVTDLQGLSRAKRIAVRYGDLPQTLVQALLAAEDRRFFEHAGIDPVAIVRAAGTNLRHWEVRQGASTLTQQLARGRYLDDRRTVKRKLDEICLALLLERRYEKREILETYANMVYLGRVGAVGITGLGQGARAFFGKELGQLTLAESALLAGVICAPNRLSPYRHAAAAVSRRNQVLRQMLDSGAIAQPEYLTAIEGPLGVVPDHRFQTWEAPHFVDYVARQLADLADAEGPSGLRVYTSLDLDLQRAASAAVTAGLEGVQKRLQARSGTDGAAPTADAALVALDPANGEILAMVGGKDYRSSQFNRAVDASRQPGSAFKPWVYAAALEWGPADTAQAGFGLETVLEDEPTEFDFSDVHYAPRNYGDRYHGRVTLRQALALSLNVPTVQLVERIGLPTLAQTVTKVGLDPEGPAYPSMSLGAMPTTPLQLAQSYTPFACGGVFVPARTVRRLEGVSGTHDLAAAPRREVISPEVAYLITSALEDAIDVGTGQRVRELGFDLPAAGKTGTARDGWFAGYTPDLLAVVWVGVDDGTELDLSGAEAALPIWTRFMLAAKDLGRLSGREFAVPEGVVALVIDPTTGQLATDRCPERRTEYFRSRAAPTTTCDLHRRGLWSRIANLFR